MRTCPLDGSTLVPETMFGVEIDICPKCDGAWFDDGELRKASLSLPERLDQLEREILATEKVNGASPLMCPVDGKAMDVFEYLYKSKIELHSCPACFGVWVDDGELRSMAHVLDAAQKEEVSKGAMHQLKAAELMAQHEVEMERHRMFQRVTRFFSMRKTRLI